MASPKQRKYTLLTAVSILLVATSFAPSAHAGRMLQASSTTVLPATAAPVQTKPTASLVFGTVGPTKFPQLPAGTDSCPGTGSEVVCCPEETGYMRVAGDGNPYAFACQKTYPIAQSTGELAGSDGSFPDPKNVKTDSWALFRDYYERPTGDIIGRCYQLTKEILDLASYTSLNPNMYLVTNTGRLYKAGELASIEAWFESYFKDKKPTVQIFDVAFESAIVTNVYKATVRASFTVRAETDTQVVKFRADWVNPLPVTDLQKWTLQSVTEVKVVVKS